MPSPARTQALGHDVGMRLAVVEAMCPHCPRNVAAQHICSWPGLQPRWPHVATSALPVPQNAGAMPGLGMSLPELSLWPLRYFAHICSWGFWVPGDVGGAAPGQGVFPSIQLLAFPFQLHNAALLPFPAMHMSCSRQDQLLRKVWVGGGWVAVSIWLWFPPGSRPWAFPHALWGAGSWAAWRRHWQRAMHCFLCRCRAGEPIRIADPGNPPALPEVRLGRQKGD